VSNLRKLFAKLIDTNENIARKIIELGKKMSNTKEKRAVGRSRTQNYMAPPCRAPKRKTHDQIVINLAQLSVGRYILYSEVVAGKATQKVQKVTVTSRDNQTAETLKEMRKSQKIPARNNSGNRIY